MKETNYYEMEGRFRQLLELAEKRDQEERAFFRVLCAVSSTCIAILAGLGPHPENVVMMAILWLALAALGLSNLISVTVLFAARLQEIRRVRLFAEREFPQNGSCKKSDAPGGPGVVPPPRWTLAIVGAAYPAYTMGVIALAVYAGLPV